MPHRQGLPDFDDDLTPPIELPAPADIPLEIARMKLTLAQQAKAIRELHAERVETRKGMRAIWLSIAGASVAIVIAALGALIQMGAYMERIDNVAQSQQRILLRLDHLDSQ